jgi:hypothetical protein
MLGPWDHREQGLVDRDHPKFIGGYGATHSADG